MQYVLKQFFLHLQSLHRPQTYQRGHALLFAVLLLTVCLFKPTIPLPHAVYDWLIVIDISQSMNVRDYEQEGKGLSRLAFAKEAVMSAVRTLPCGSKVAVAIFAERDALNIVRPVETCEHYASIDQTVSHLDWRMEWAADSFIAHGTYRAIDLALQLGDDYRLAFITDGQQAPPSDPRYMPSFEGEVGKVKGYLLGAGQHAHSKIPKFSDRDEIIGYWEPADVQRYANFGMTKTLSALAMANQQKHRNSGHAPEEEVSTDAHLSWLDADNLEKIADETGMQYAKLSSNQQLGELLQSIPAANKRVAETDIRPWLVIPAGALILFYFYTAFLHTLWWSKLQHRPRMHTV